MSGSLDKWIPLFLPWKQKARIPCSKIKNKIPWIFDDINVRKYSLLSIILFPVMVEHSSKMVTSQLKDQAMCMHDLPLNLEYNVRCFLWIIKGKEWKRMFSSGQLVNSLQITLSSRLNFSFSVICCFSLNFSASNTTGESRDAKTSAMGLNLVGDGLAT